MHDLSHTSKASYRPGEHVGTLAWIVFLRLSPVHSAEVLPARAEDVSSFQLVCFVSLHVASRSHHGCSHTGLQFLPGRTTKARRKCVC